MSILLRSKAKTAAGVAAAIVGLLGFIWWVWSPQAHSSKEAANSHTPVTHVSHPAQPTLVEFPRASWAAAGVDTQAVRQGPFEQTITLTGKITLNEDRVSHIYPLVEGRVEEVRVQFGQRVNAADVLVIVQSKEVGQAKLQLFQDRLQRELAITKDKWTQESSANAIAMLELIRSDASLEAIESKLRDRPLGEYRDKLMSAYLEHYRAKLHFDRLSPLAKDGAVPGKQVMEAEATRNAARTTLQSLVEQISQDARQASTASAQAVKDLQTRVAVDETALQVMGFDKSELSEVNPAKLGEAISHYTIRAPFSGTVISKDVTPLERISPESQILSIADLSTVWVTADVFEEHLPRLNGLLGKTIELRSSSWSEEVFSAKVFYTGDIVHETSRTVSLRAIADNGDGRLKPGMFVNISIKGVDSREVLQVPPTAVQEHAGKSFIFLQLNDHQFERRDVTIGRRNEAAVEITAGLKATDRIATAGCFALKSQMLAELLAE